jgi:chromosome segregation ATPase
MSELEDVQTTVAVIDGLRSRIAELEAEVERKDAEMVEQIAFTQRIIDKRLEAEAENELVKADFDRMQRDWKHEKICAKQAEARCKELAEETADRIGALNKAEAALAERDRMLAWCYDYVEVDVDRPTLDEWLADLRARAEEGGEDE